MPTTRLLLACFSLLLLGSPSRLLATDDLELRLATEPVTFAEEIFGADATEAVFGTAADIKVILQVVSGTGVTVGNEGSIEFRLTQGARFAGRDLNASDLLFTEDSNSGGGRGNVTISLLAGGRVGDGSVTFRIVADFQGDSETLALEAPDQLELTLPGLQGISLRSGLSVRVQVVTAALVAGPVGNFQDGTLTHGGNLDGNDTASSIVSDLLAFTASRFTPTATTGAGAGIDINDRTQLVGNAVARLRVDGETLQGLPLAAVHIPSGDANAAGPDGNLALALADSDNIQLAVTGAFNAGARAFVDLNANAVLDAGESIPRDGTGLRLAATGAGAALLGVTARQVYLVANGVTPLLPDTYTVSLLLDFNQPGYRDERATTNPLSVGFAGIREDGFAYAVPNCMQSDRARIRITNETPRPTSLFVRGMDQAGMDMGFVQVDVAALRGTGQAGLAPFETVVLFTRDLGRIFNYNDGSFGLDMLCEAGDTWTGRAQLTFFSAENITVLSMIRGSDRQLRDLGGYTGLVIN